MTDEPTTAQRWLEELRETCDCDGGHLTTDSEKLVGRWAAQIAGLKAALGSWRQVALTEAHASSPIIETQAATILHLGVQVRALEQERDRWKNAIIDACVVDWVLTKEHETNPRKAINDLLVQAQRIALDPAVSKPAAELHDRIKALEREINGDGSHNPDPVVSLGLRACLALNREQIALLTQERDALLTKQSVGLAWQQSALRLQGHHREVVEWLEAEIVKATPAWPHTDEAGLIYAAKRRALREALRTLREGCVSEIPPLKTDFRGGFGDVPAKPASGDCKCGHDRDAHLRHSVCMACACEKFEPTP